jgi:hypothetical protein
LAYRSSSRLMTNLPSKHIFLSYSRRQFYFAEAVVLGLQEAGIAVWFDVQQLGPGVQWREQIAKGLDEAGGLVMVASEAAIVSKYVRGEWEPMIDTGRPVYVVLFEACELPPKLRDNAVAIIDMRGKFGSGLRKLKRAVNGETIPPPKHLPSNEPFGLPGRVPLAVGFVAAMMMIVATVLVYMVVTTFRSDLLMTYMAVTLEAYLLYTVAWAMLRRRYQFISVWLLLSVAAISYSQVWQIYLPILAGLLVFLFAPGCYRWLPTGQAPKWMRRRYRAVAAPTIRQTSENLDQFETPNPQRYRLTYEPADKWIAEQVRAAMDDGGHQLLADEMPSRPDDQHIVVLSNATRAGDVQAIMQQDPTTLTPVIASNINVRAVIDDVANFQFIDYRTHARDQLDAIATLYRHPNAARLIYGTSITPLSLSMLLYPRGVRRFSGVNHAVAIYTFGIGFSFLWFSLPIILETGLSDRVSLIYALFVVLTVIVAGLHVWQGVRVRQRAITRLRYQTELAIIIGLSLLLVLITSDLNVLLYFGGPQLILLVVSHKPLGRWLPQQGLRREGGRLPLVSHRAEHIRVLRDVAIVIVFIALLRTTA